jgi:hypothetical protein
MLGCGNFGAPPNPPCSSSKRLASCDSRGERVGPELAGFRLRLPGGLRELLRDLVAMRDDAVAVVLPAVGDALEHRHEAGPSAAILRREVGSADEGGQVRGEPHTHRPAAAAGGGLHERHVNLVHVGPFLAVHLDADEVLVEELRRRLVLERLVCHHMAPMAGRVADAQEDRLVLLARLFKSLLAPRMPVHGVVLVLQKVG